MSCPHANLQDSTLAFDMMLSSNNGTAILVALASKGQCAAMWAVDALGALSEGDITSALGYLREAGADAKPMLAKLDAAQATPEPIKNSIQALATFVTCNEHTELSNIIVYVGTNLIGTSNSLFGSSGTSHNPNVFTSISAVAKGFVSFVEGLAKGEETQARHHPSNALQPDTTFSAASSTCTALPHTNRS